MNRRLMTVLSFALVLALGVSFLVYRVMGKKMATEKTVQVTRIISASTDLKIGTILTSANLTTMEVSGTLPKGAILQASQALGRGVLADIYQGEPIVESRLAAPGSGGGLAATIPPGMRACAVKVDEVVGVAGFVTPGMHVDVLVSGDAPGNPDPREGTEVKTLLQDIRVLSAGTDIQPDAEGKPKQVHVVNLLVTPDQAQTLSLASNHTQIQLVLRNPLDTQTADVHSTALGNIFSGSTVPPKPVAAHIRRAAPPTTQTVSIEVVSGDKRSEQKFVVPEAKE